MSLITNENYAMQLSPPGRGAVATLMVQGPSAERMVRELFLPAGKSNLRENPPGRICYGRWRAIAGEDVVAFRRPAKPDQVEVHCHGGDVAASAILRDLENHGCIIRPWQEWVRTTAADSIRAEAAVALAAARTQRTADILLDQFHGALSDSITSILADLQESRHDLALTTLADLIGFSELGLHLTCPWRVVLAGRPNVGKSSLVNALIGFERAIVWDTPGTTRDLVTAVTAIDGWPVELIDTAGLRISGDSLEMAGVEHAMGALQSADLVLLVSACGDTGRDEEPFLQQRLGGKLLSVRNKVDLRPAELDKVPTVPGEASVATSATTGAGIDELVRAIGRSLVPQDPVNGGAVPFTTQHVQVFRDAFDALDCGDAVAARKGLDSLRSGNAHAG